MDILKPEKLILIFRHGNKDEKGHVTQECLDKIIREGIPGAGLNINTVHYGSGFIRTEETVTALVLWLLRNNCRPEFGLDHDDRFGSQRWLDVFSPSVREEGAKLGYNFYQMIKHLAPEEYAAWRAELNDAILEVFDAMESGDICALPAHSPTVELVDSLFADKEDESLQIKEMEGIFLLMTSEGEIKVIRG